MVALLITNHIGTLALDEPKKLKHDGTLFSSALLSIDYVDWFNMFDIVDSLDLALHSSKLHLTVESGNGQLRLSPRVV